MKEATEQLLRKYTKPPEKYVKALSNSWVTYNRCVAYCFKHHSYLTLTQLKNRQCPTKDCKHCMKLPHQYWEDRKNRRNKSRERRKRIFTPLHR